MLSFVLFTVATISGNAVSSTMATTVVSAIGPVSKLKIPYATPAVNAMTSTNIAISVKLLLPPDDFFFLLYVASSFLGLIIYF